MPKRSSKKPKSEDEAQAAVRVIAVIAERSEDERKPEKNAAAVELGRLGGLKGGRARADSLSAEERAAIARKAAAARWTKRKEPR